jgi:hypothetical protein
MFVKKARERERSTMEDKKRGRPTASPKTYRESFRLSENDMEKIRACMEATGMSKTDVIRKSIECFYETISK